MRRRREPDDRDLGVVGAPAWHRPAPVVLVPERCPLLGCDLLAPRHEARASPADRNAVGQLVHRTGGLGEPSYLGGVLGDRSHHTSCTTSTRVRTSLPVLESPAHAADGQGCASSSSSHSSSPASSRRPPFRPRRLSSAPTWPAGSTRTTRGSPGRPSAPRGTASCSSRPPRVTPT